MGWESLILPAAVAGLSYFDYKDKKKRSKELDKKYQAYRAAEMLKAGQPSSGGGGGGSRGGGGAGAAQSLLSEYYAKANDALNPYVQVGKEVLPVQAEAFKKGLAGFDSFAGQTLNPQFLRNALTYNRPEEAPLPAYLKGGK